MESRWTFFLRKGKESERKLGFDWSWGEDPPSFDQIPYFTILAFPPLFFPFLYKNFFFGKGTNRRRKESRWDFQLAVKVKMKGGVRVEREG